MISEFEIRQLVANYLVGQSDLRQLNAHLAPMRFDPRNPLDVAAEEVLSEVEGRLAEFAHGDWSEIELRDLLLPLGPVVMTMETFTSSSSESETLVDSGSHSRVLETAITA